MKITKEQTAIIVMGIAGILGGLFVINIVRLHPIMGVLIAIAGVGVGVGYYMYNRNKGE